MNRIEKTFKGLKTKNEMALIPYITAGDFGLETTKRLIYTIYSNGADLLEIGIPYSDPVADGPVIERASARALKNGVKLEQIFKLVESVRNDIDIPILFMLYYNTILRYGPEKFISKCGEIGIDGLIVPDLPYEEADELFDITGNVNVDLIYFAAPTSADRIKKITQKAEGFLYCVSSTGVTGERKHFSGALTGMLDAIKNSSDIPRAVGFGISGPDQIKELKGKCEAAIVGSAIVKNIEAYGGTEELYNKIEIQIKELKSACI